MKTHYERSIEVDVSVQQAYACWERYQDFPVFAGALEEVTPLGPDRIRWRARFLPGVGCEWTAQVTERIPGRRIAWFGRSGPPNAGCVTFHRLADDRTRVMLQMDYLPGGLLAAAGDILGVPRRCIDAALEGFKAYVEAAETDPDAAAALPGAAPPASSMGVTSAAARWAMNG